VVVERGVAGRAGAMRAIAPCWGNARHRPTHVATRLPSAGPSEALAEVLCRRRQRYKHASVLELPPRSFGQWLELVEGTSPWGLTCQCKDTAEYIYSFPMHISRVLLLLLRLMTRTSRRYVAARANLPLHRYSQIYLLFPNAHLPSSSSPVAAASGRWPWRTATSTWPQHIFIKAL
jgi:hypothetical protein